MKATTEYVIGRVRAAIDGDTDSVHLPEGLTATMTVVDLLVELAADLARENSLRTGLDASEIFEGVAQRWWCDAGR
jgi:hypothetical protein